MKLVFKGKCSANQLSKRITEVVADIVARTGITEDAKIIIENAELNVIFKVGNEESYLTVPREINGQEVQDIFTVTVPLTEKGTIKATLDNEEESLVDDKTLAEANGIEYEYSEIESDYEESELIYIDTFGDDVAKSVRYSIVGTELELIRFYKGEKLVGEQIVDPALMDE